MFISLQGAEWYGTKLHTGLMCTSLISFHSRRSPLCSSWRPRRPSHQTSSWQPGILCHWSCGVEQSADRYSICTNSLYFQESTQDSFVFTVLFCTLSFINLIRVAYVVRRPCSDFTDMLRRHINCRIIITVLHDHLKAYAIMLSRGAWFSSCEGLIVLPQTS